MIAALKTYMPFYRRNLSLAVPIMISQLGQTITNIVDTIMIGHVGLREFAGASFAIFVYLIPFFFLISFCSGITPFIGNSVGEGNPRKAASFFAKGIAINSVLSIALVILCYAVMPLFPYMGQDPGILPFSRSYYWVIVLSIPPAALFFTFKSFSEALGNTRIPMFVTIGINILNIFLNWCMIYGHCGFAAMGVTGAAWATLISRIVGAAALWVIFINRKEYSPVMVYLSRHAEKHFSTAMVKGKITAAEIARGAREVMAKSAGIGFQGLLEGVVFSVSAFISGWFGRTAIAAYNIADQLSTATYMIAMGVGQASTIRVSTWVGEGKFEHIRKAGFAALHLALFFMVCCGILFIIFRKAIPYIFVSEPHAAALAADLIVLVSAYQVFDATQLSGICALRGLKDVKIPLICSFISYYIIGMPCAYLLAVQAQMGPRGVIIGLMAGLATAAVLFISRFLKLTRNY